MYELILKYLKSLREGLPVLPGGVEALLPYESSEVFDIAGQFYKKYYSDSEERSLILGINPGRHGAGMTGIPFTDPKRLEAYCGISTHMYSHEPSSEFVYHVIEAYGGAQAFYSDFFISSVSPIGFVKGGKNYNYYDDPKLADRLESYIAYQMQQLLKIPLRRTCVICFGEGKNYEYLSRYNEKFGWFEEILPLAHPRFVMQYKRKEIQAYVDRYLKTFDRCRKH